MLRRVMRHRRAFRSAGLLDDALQAWSPLHRGSMLSILFSVRSSWHASRHDPRIRRRWNATPSLSLRIFSTSILWARQVSPPSEPAKSMAPQRLCHWNLCSPCRSIAAVRRRERDVDRPVEKAGPAPPCTPHKRRWNDARGRNWTAWGQHGPSLNISLESVCSALALYNENAAPCVDDNQRAIW